MKRELVVRPWHPALKLAVWVQGIFYVLTGVWPLVSIETFEAVTGPKVDDWLVQTVGLLVIVVGAAVLVAGWLGRVALETAVVAIGAAAALTVIDVLFVSLGRISPIYLLDAVAETALIICWVVGIGLSRNRVAVAVGTRA